jgi:uncharacterized protein (DUF2147 family)
MKSLLSFILMILFSTLAKAQSADDVLGNWKNGEGTGTINIYKTTSGHYAGKIIWLKEPIDAETGKAKLDKRNPDKKKRSMPTLGLVNLYNFIYDEKDKKYTGGKVYDPKKGKEYSCKMTLVSKNKLDVRGFIGISLIGRTDTWTREEK